MCVIKLHAFIYFLRPPPWSGTPSLWEASHSPSPPSQPSPPHRPHTHHTDQYCGRCLFLKPLLKYLKKEFKKTQKYVRTIMLLQLLLKFQTKTTPADLEWKGETTPKQFSSVLYTKWSTQCTVRVQCPLPLYLSLKAQEYLKMFKEKFNSRRPNPHVLSFN